MGYWKFTAIFAALFAVLGAVCEYYGVIRDPAAWAFFGYLFGIIHALAALSKPTTEGS